MKKQPNTLAAQLHEAAAEARKPDAKPGPTGEPLFENANQVKVARIAAAGIALHALVARGVQFDHDRLIDEAFAIADKFLAKAGP